MGGRLRAGALVAAILLASPAFAAGRWIAGWGSAQMTPTGENALPAGPGAVTLRQIVRLSAGGKRVRVRFSNVFGREPLVIGGAALGRPAASGSARLTPASGRTLTFAGLPSVTIAPGAEVSSDPVALAVAAGDDLAISLYLPTRPVGQTGHPGARATSFIAAGNRVADDALSGAEPSVRWWALADVEVEAAETAATIVAIGDSITDGHGVKPDSNTRWTDILAQRLRAGGAAVGVVNAGIGGNRVLLDGIGPNLLARFDRDVIARSGVKWAILLEGVNDLGVVTRDAPATAEAHGAIVARLRQAYVELAARAHAHGIQLIGGTIMPFGGNDYYHPGAETEADRQAVNRFIRKSGVFDAVIDFDRLLRDPIRPDRLLPTYDSGDHLHPSAEGYRAMGEAVPLGLFAPGRTARPLQLALTFDDLPEHGPLPAGVTPGQPIREIVAALQGAGVAAPHGFINAAHNPGPDGAAALAAWRAAGFPLGNHGFDHRNLADLDTAGFERELTANEPALRGLMGKEDWRWFRYPFLSEGTDPARRDAARAVLHAHGYRVAAVTMDFGDYAWNGAYARCLAKGDDAAITALEESYLRAARIGAVRSREGARIAYGGDIPYVLLMHVGAFDARMLARLLALYRELGFAFVPLALAQAHPAYRAAMDLALPGPSVDTSGAKDLVLARTPLPDAICA